MKSRIRTHKKSTREQTPDFSTAPAQPIFQSRPFVVQSKTAEQSQKSDLKTSLMRAQRYGHHLSQMPPVGVWAPKAVQPKLGNGQQNESESAKAPQELQAATVQKRDKSNRRKSEAQSEGLSTSGEHQQNQTGMPDNLKSGVETLSGLSLNDVKVHYNSTKPAQLQAHAYTQGSDIHVAPGQEQHLPHEAWHVAQQKQGRVKPTVQVKGAQINDDAGLEKEADVMGAKALQEKADSESL
jgi:hypothetical protein